MFRDARNKNKRLYWIKIMSGTICYHIGVHLGTVPSVHKQKKTELMKRGSACTQVVMQSYPPRALDRRLQEDWVREAREGLRVLMSLMVDFGPMG